MNRFSLILLIGMLLMLWGVSGVSKLSETAISAGFDGSVVSNVNAPGRLILVGFIGSRVASELIRRGERTVIIKDEDRSLANDKINDRKPGDVVN
jgi:molybdopterin/thiamine biosynthesis adenylyltransferase